MAERKAKKKQGTKAKVGGVGRPKKTAESKPRKKAAAVAGRKAATKTGGTRRLTTPPAEVQHASLEDWLERVRMQATTAAEAGSARGACLVSDPAGGPAMCLLVDRDTCRAIRGTFVGGPC